MDLKELGFTQEELQQKVVETIVHDLMKQKNYDYDEDCACLGDSAFSRKLSSMMDDKIEESMRAMFEQKASGEIKVMIDEFIINHTDKCGEKINESESLSQFIVKKAESILNERVKFNGVKSDSYNSRDTTTRLEYMFNKAFDGKVSKLIDESVDHIKQTIENSLEESIQQRISTAFTKMRANLTISK